MSKPMRKSISIEEAASLRGVEVIRVPPLDELGTIPSPTYRLEQWLYDNFGYRFPRDNVYAGDRLVARLKAAEVKYQGDKSSAGWVNANSGPLEQFEACDLTGDDVFIFPGPGRQSTD